MSPQKTTKRITKKERIKDFVYLLLALIIIGAFILYFFGISYVSNKGKIYALYQGQKFELSTEDEEKVDDILNFHFMYPDSPSCGYSESLGIEFDSGEHYFIAQDTCPTIEDEKRNRYFDLSESAMDQLKDILEKYKVHFVR